MKAWEYVFSAYLKGIETRGEREAAEGSVFVFSVPKRN